MDSAEQPSIIRPENEIADKIKVMRQSRRKLTRNIWIFRIILIIIVYANGMGFIIVGRDLNLKPGPGDPLLLFGIYCLSCMPLLIPYHFIVRKWKIKRIRRRAIADALEEVYFILPEPDGEDRIIKDIDHMIKEQAGAKKNFLTSFPLRHLMRIDTARIRKDAWLQAFTWVASPGGVARNDEL